MYCLKIDGIYNKKGKKATESDRLKGTTVNMEKLEYSKGEAVSFKLSNGELLSLVLTKKSVREDNNLILTTTNKRYIFSA